MKPNSPPRADQGRFWWELRACTYYSDFSKPKIYWPENNPPSDCAFAFDESTSYSNNKAYFVSAVPFQLCAFLNSSVSLWLFDKIATKLRGGWLELRSGNVVGRLPVPASIEELPNEAMESSALHSIASEVLRLTADESDLIWDWYVARQVYKSEEPNNPDTGEVE